VSFAVEISEHHGEGQLAEELSDPLNALTDLISEEHIVAQIPDRFREPFIQHLDYQLPNRSSVPFDVRCRTVMRLLREWIKPIMQMQAAAQQAWSHMKNPPRRPGRVETG
jgi:hypothetical protein